MAEKELPADWMIKRALEVMGYKAMTLRDVKTSPHSFVEIINVAHYIGEHEAAPVDPDLLIAREAVAQLNDEGKYTDTAQDTRDGKRDRGCEVRSALHAIKLARERGAL